MANQAENQAKIDALADVLGKVLGEVQDLKRRYNEGQTLDFSRADALAAQVDAESDDLAVVTPQPPVEETPSPQEPTA